MYIAVNYEKTNKVRILPNLSVCLNFLVLIFFLHSSANPATVFIAILGRVVDEMTV